MRTMACSMARGVVLAAISGLTALSIAGCPQVADSDDGGPGQVAGDTTENSNIPVPVTPGRAEDQGGAPDGQPIPPVIPPTPITPPPITPPPDSQTQVEELIAAVRAQLADRLFETAASGGSGSDALTGINRIGLCGFGVGRIVEQTIFSGGTPTEFLDFNSDTTIDGVWSVELANGRLFLVLRNALIPGPEAANAPEVRRFAIGLDAAGRVISLGNSTIRDVQDVADACRDVQAQGERLRAASGALAGRRFQISTGGGSAELVLCPSGNYGLALREGGVTIEAESGVWSVILEEASLILQLDATPVQPGGSPARSTVSIEIRPDGTVQIGTGTTTQDTIGGDCEAAIQTLISG